MKKIASFTALLVLSVIGFALFSTSSASAADLTWTGGGDGTTTNDQSNWQPAQSPAAGDTLILPPLSGVPTKQINFNTSANVGIIYFSRDPNIKTDYVINGSVTARQITADSDADVSFMGNVEFGQYVGAPTTPFRISSDGETKLTFESPSMIFNTNVVSSVLIDGDGEVIMNPAAVASSGQISGIDINGSSVTLAGQATGISNVNLTIKQNSSANISNLAWLGSNTILEINSAMGLPTGSQVESTNIVVHEGSLIYSIVGASSEDIILTESSRLALMGEAQFRSNTNNVDLVIKGDICNVTLDISCDNPSNSKFKINPTNDSYGAVVVAQAQGKENASNMVNGDVIEPPYQTEVISGEDSGNISVRPYRIIVINGSASQVTVFDKGILKGTGTISELVVEAGGRVAPGNSPGILNVGDTVLSSGSLFEVEIAGTEAGSGYDQLKVTGTISVDDSVLDLVLIDDFRPESGNKFVIVDNDGSDAVTGTFRDAPEGSTINIDGVEFSISYVGGDGNDVELTVLGVVETDSAVNAPGTPNTGVKLLLANPILTLVGTTLSAGGLFTLGRKYGAFNR